MGVELPLADKTEVLAAIDAASPEKPVRIATVNPEFILEAQSNQFFRQALAQMSHCVIDGAGLFMMLKLWRRVHKTAFKTTWQRYPGADLVSDLIALYQNGQKSFYLLGGPPGLASEAATSLQERYPHLKISGSSDGGVINKQNPQVAPETLNNITEAQTDILLVGFGAPKQELWIQAARNSAIPVMIGVGGTFGFFGQKKRAPLWLRKLNLEWLFRVLVEPGHWRRAWRAVVVFSGKSLLWIAGHR